MVVNNWGASTWLRAAKAYGSEYDFGAGTFEGSEKPDEPKAFLSTQVLSSRFDLVLSAAVDDVDGPTNCGITIEACSVILGLSVEAVLAVDVAPSDFGCFAFKEAAASSSPSDSLSEPPSLELLEPEAKNKASISVDKRKSSSSEPVSGTLLEKGMPCCFPISGGFEHPRYVTMESAAKLAVLAADPDPNSFRELFNRLLKFIQGRGCDFLIILWLHYKKIVWGEEMVLPLACLNLIEIGLHARARARSST
jgi:hypothetical protein